MLPNIMKNYRKQKKLIVILIFASILLSCQSEKKVSEKQDYLRWVGDIEQNDKIDQLDSKACHGDDEILQYFNLGEGPIYSGEKSTILNIFKSRYRPLADKEQNGLIRIRFFVNCKGKAGRFRVLQSDYNYQEIKFDNRIVTQLADITKSIENWKVLYRREVPVDYYMYLIFKITNGQLTEILP